MTQQINFPRVYEAFAAAYKDDGLISGPAASKGKTRDITVLGVSNTEAGRIYTAVQQEAGRCTSQAELDALEKEVNAELAKGRFGKDRRAGANPAVGLGEATQLLFANRRDQLDKALAQAREREDAYKAAEAVQKAAHKATDSLNKTWSDGALVPPSIPRR